MVNDSSSTQSAKNIYLFSLIKSAKSNLSGEYSFLTSDLLQIEHEISIGFLGIEDFASRVLQAFEVKPNHFNICRVCLVHVFPLSQRLSVLSSANHETISENTVKPGYSCYTSTTSSLFQVKSANVRIYHDIDKVIESYERAKKPVQRSMSRLKAMGVKSGIAIPLEIGEATAGFLFLNSSVANAFKDFKDEDYLLCCLLKVIGKSVLLHQIHGVGGLVQSRSRFAHFLGVTPNVFHPKLFCKTLELMFREKSGKQIKVSLSDSPKVNFLYPSEGVAQLLTQFLSATMILSTQFEYKILVTQSEDGKKVVLQIDLDPSLQSQNAVAFAQNIRSWPGIAIQAGDGHVQIVTDLDPVQGAEYSV